MRKMIVVLMAAALLMGCAGIVRNAETVSQPSRKITCDKIDDEIKLTRIDIGRVANDRYWWRGLNTFNGIVWIVSPLNLLFLDFGNADADNCNAYINKYNYLVDLAEDRECGFNYNKVAPSEWDNTTFRSEWKAAGEPDYKEKPEYKENKPMTGVYTNKPDNWRDRKQSTGNYSGATIVDSKH